MHRVGSWALVCLLVLSVPSFSNGSCADQVASPKNTTTFGFEVEYVPGENPGLWNLYRPAHVTESQWQALTPAQKDAWVTANAKDLAPIKREPSGLVRSQDAPAYLPERLIMDETGNWEIIGGILSDYGTLKSQTSTVEKIVAPGSYQAHVVQPIHTLQTGAAGYTLFSADLLAFRKLTSQLQRFQKDPKSVPGAFFMHPFLSVYTEVKKDMLLSVMQANQAGLTWETVIPKFAEKYPEWHTTWAENRPLYKYTLANTFRTDIYGNTPGKLIRWGFEVRGSHKSLESLLTEVRVLESLMTKGFQGFDRFSGLSVVNPETFTKVFSTPVQTMLLAVIPESEWEDPRPYYFTYLTRPWEQYTQWLGLSEMESRTLRGNILKARTKALETLQTLSQDWALKQVDDKAAKDRALVVLAQFAADTGLLPYMERYLNSQTGLQEEATKKAS